MKIAVFSESAADEQAIHILLDALLGVPSERASSHDPRTRGWPSIRNILPKVIKQYHYNDTDVDALVVVVDSNGSPVHESSHDGENQAVPKCRLCELHRTAKRALAELKAVHGRKTLKIAAGLAVPAIEAWWRCGIDHHVTEAAWIRGLHTKQLPFTTVQLKKDVYGTDRPSLQLEIRRMSEEAKRLANDLRALETHFPRGFGPLAAQVRSWRPA
jgi:hypothetical protein